MTLRCLGDRVIFKVVTPRMRTSGGLHLPYDENPQLHEGLVIAAGPKANIAQAARILVPKHVCMPVDYHSERYYSTSTKDIIGVIEE